MPKLFDADGFKEILEAKSEVLRIGCPDNQYGLFLNRVSKMVGLLPGVEAEPVVHAHWISVHRHRGGIRTRCGIDQYGVEHEIQVDDRWEEDSPQCSHCRRFTEDDFPPYCPHCGAIMRKEVTDDGI